jgi:nucleotide-binding universal stress UspA family protein
MAALGTAPPADGRAVPRHSCAARSIVCAVGAAGSRPAIEGVGSLARVLRSRLVLVHDANLRAGCRGWSQSLVEAASVERAELVVARIPHRALLDRVLLCRRLQTLVCRAPCPVVAVPHDAERWPDTDLASERPGGSIVCGVGGAASSLMTAAVAADFASRCRMRVIAVHAYEQASRATVEPLPGPAGPEPADEDERRAWALLTRTVKDLDDAVEGRFVLGRPAEVLQRVATREESSLIVVGVSGAGPLRSALCGTVSAQIATAARPVMIVPPAARRWPRPA